MKTLSCMGGQDNYPTQPVSGLFQSADPAHRIAIGFDEDLLGLVEDRALLLFVILSGFYRTPRFLYPRNPALLPVPNLPSLHTVSQNKCNLWFVGVWFFKESWDQWVIRLQCALARQLCRIPATTEICYEFDACQQAAFLDL